MNFTLGFQFYDRDQPNLSADEAEIVTRFHELYYEYWRLRGGDTINLSWFGYEVRKCPLDLWVYQELIVRTRPDILIETGTYMGGSTLFIATVMDVIGQGRVISIDNKDRGGRPIHPRISYWRGSSVDASIVSRVTEEAAGKRVMAVFDSDHSQAHVLGELICYSPLVQVGDYLVVEDTNVNGHPTYAEYGPGPMEAVDKFLDGNDEFIIDKRCERFLMTLNPKGYLKRVRPGKKPM